jgi:RecQ family ATP-dependent DNA helicase
MTQDARNTLDTSPVLSSQADRALTITDTGLKQLLYSAFGFTSFRPTQEAVCRAAIDGKDVLLVMPTGSGKSLCYQLPGIARGGTTLVICPLIALMEDQVAKLRRQGLAVDSIHSGRDRAASRKVCIDYLAGRLQFLFIAPERLRVTSFPEMLAKRKPSLVAIDEAHCISQWGHDFRPDYRMLGQYLPTLRPAPVIAVTATATPLVQNDIAKQLKLAHPERFIQGFRRNNIAIEVVEIARSERATLARDILFDGARRPAIIYAPTRKQAEAVTAEITDDCPTAAYHAGLDADHRRRVQEDFLSGKLEVMVATVAFGMGIDKPDVRTVIHTGLPGSLEGYYQEIGRAGRDGAPSRAILMQSYADRHTHDFFFKRDYPDIAVVDEIYAMLTAAPVNREVLQRQLKLDPELFDKALEKLWIHSGAVFDHNDNITRGGRQWRQVYLAHGQQKGAQINLMIRYARSAHCRMSALLRHFGDLADSETSCGICDFCAPAQCVAQRFRTATSGECATLFRVLAALRNANSKSTGKLHSELCPSGEMNRNCFEEVLGAMARAGLLYLSDAVLEKDRKQIPYRSAKLTRAGYGVDETTPINFIMKDLKPGSSKRASKSKANSWAKTAAEQLRESNSGAERYEIETVETLRIADALRLWRRCEAKRLALPPFCIFNDRVLQTIAAKRPGSDRDLLPIPGVGRRIVEKYGADIYGIVRRGNT